MTLEQIEARIWEREARKKELAKKIKETDDVRELREINEEIDRLNNELIELRGRLPVGPLRPVASFPYGLGGGDATANIINRGVGTSMHLSKELRAALEEKGRLLLERRAVTFTQEEAAELRAITVASGTVVTGKAVSPEITPAFQQVSSLVDLVNSPVLIGAESYQKPFMVSAGTGGYTTEGAAYTDAEPTFDYVSIAKAKITAYAEISEELKRLSPADYATAVFNAVRDAVRKKLAKEIVLGDGATGHLVGIYNAPANVMPPVAVDLEIGAIDKDALDKIVLAYGGDEAVELDQPCLILNKADLAAFAAVRATDGKKLYTIEYNGGIGTISSDGSFKVRFVINSACPALSAAGTPAGTLTLLYGYPSSYEMPLFSNLEVQESADYKFKEGLVAIKGMVMVGGNVGRYKGFVRVKKAA